MIWIFVIIISAAVILVIFLKKLPQIKSVNFGFLKNVFKKSEERPTIDRKREIVQKKREEPINLPFFGKSKSEENLFDEADMLFKHGNFDEAEKLYIKIAAINPKNVKVYNRLGVIYMERKNFRDAKEAFLMAVRLDRKKASRHYNLATAYEEMREYRNAIESLEEAIKLDKNNAKYKTYLEKLNERVDYRYKEMKRTETDE